MNKALIIIALGAVATLFAACSDNLLFEEKKPVAGGAWAYADSLRFEFDLADTGRVYNLFVDVDHTDGFPYENLYVRINTVFPSGKRQSKVRSLQLAGPAGEWLGSGSGKKISARVELQERTIFKEPGRYALIFEQYLRRDSVPGIGAIGLAVERTGEKRVK